MPIEHSLPTASTVKMLYAHAYRCGFKGCKRPLYRVDDYSGERTLNSNVCHIHARSEGGPRWNINQSAKENRSAENLILMCLEHAKVIDNTETASFYPAAKLKKWKLNQIQEYETLTQGWSITDKMSEEAIKDSFGDKSISIQKSIIDLAGRGGSAPGAGGGGGGALGTNARGGDGGSGGELVSQLLDVSLLQSLGWDGEAEIIIGDGGKSGSLPGQHGKDGTNTELIFRRFDGGILKKIIAKGGSSGRSGNSYLPQGVREVDDAEGLQNFRITTLMTANSVEINNGLLYVLGGGWRRYYVKEFPCDAVWLVICAATWDGFRDKSPRGFYVSLHNPHGEEKSCVTALVAEDVVGLKNAFWAITIGSTFDIQGEWSLIIRTENNMLSTLEIFVSEVNDRKPT